MLTYHDDHHFWGRMFVEYGLDLSLTAQVVSYELIPDIELSVLPGDAGTGCKVLHAK